MRSYLEPIIRKSVSSPNADDYPADGSTTAGIGVDGSAFGIVRSGRSRTNAWVPLTVSIIFLLAAFASLFPDTTLATTIGVYSKAQGTFYLQSSSADGTPAKPVVIEIEGAQRNWLPLLGDWSGDGLFDYGLYDPASGTFHLRTGTESGPITESFQFIGFKKRWLPIAGDWDGDTLYGVGLYDPKTGTFFLKNTLVTGPADYTLRIDGTKKKWKPLAGDWNGDGSATVGVYNPTKGEFRLTNSSLSGPADEVLKIKELKKNLNLNLIPMSGDWDNDGRWSLGFYSPARQTFYWRNDLDTGPGPIEDAEITGVEAKFLPVTGVSANVPNVVGMTSTAAINALQGANLAPGAVTKQCSDTVTADFVISQNPAASAFVAPGSKVDSVVSLGKAGILSGGMISGCTDYTFSITCEDFSETEIKRNYFYDGNGRLDIIEETITAKSGRIYHSYAEFNNLYTSHCSVTLRMSGGLLNPPYQTITLSR